MCRSKGLKLSTGHVPHYRYARNPRAHARTVTYSYLVLPLAPCRYTWRLCHTATATAVSSRSALCCDRACARDR